MTFEETRNEINRNKQILGDLYPTLRVEELLDIAFKLIRRATDNDLSEPSQNEKDDMNCFLRMTISAIIESETSKEEINILLLLLDLFQNLNIAYPTLFREPWNIRILSTLLGAKRSLDDSILLLTYLAKRVKGVFTEEDSTSFLSRKFYTEYNDFLKGKTHDDSYSVNK